MARPTRYCAKCGEYIDDGYEIVNGRTVKRLVHVLADGTYIYRNHTPVEEES